MISMIEFEYLENFKFTAPIEHYEFYPKLKVQVTLEYAKLKSISGIRKEFNINEMQTISYIRNTCQQIMNTIEYSVQNSEELSSSQKDGVCDIVRALFAPMHKGVDAVNNVYKSSDIPCAKQFHAAFTSPLVVGLLEKYYLFLDKQNDDPHIETLVSKEIEYIGLSIRVENCLKMERIYYLHQLIEKTERELLQIPNFSKKSLAEIKDTLRMYSLSLATEAPIS